MSTSRRSALWQWCGSDPISQAKLAIDLAKESGLPLSTVRKLLKELLHSGLLASHRGIRGGYILARRSLAPKKLRANPRGNRTRAGCCSTQRASDAPLRRAEPYEAFI
jgi:hypothetical protein